MTTPEEKEIERLQKENAELRIRLDESRKMWGDPARTPYVGTHPALMKYDISYNSGGSVKEPRCSTGGYSDNYNGMWR